MGKVRLLVGTQKGAFILHSDEQRQNWTVDGPHFPGWEIYHITGTPDDPNRLYVSQSSGWFGQIIQRSDDAGKTWETMNNEFLYEGETGTHLWFDGTPRPWKFNRVWHIEPVPGDPDSLYAGVEDAALFVSRDGAKSWQELPALRAVRGDQWQPGAGGMCLHTIVLNPDNPQRIVVAISAAGAFRTDDGGQSWQAINKGLRSSEELPDEDTEVGHCVHSIAMHPTNPDTLFMQKHWDVMRSDNAGGSWYEVSGNLPTDFGFPIAVHAHEPGTIYVVPIKSDSHHFPPDGKLRVYRSRSGGNEWEALTNGLPQENCYVNVLRNAMTVDTLDPCGIYFGTTGGAVYASSDSGDNWTPVIENLPRIMSVEVQLIP